MRSKEAPWTHVAVTNKDVVAEVSGPSRFKEQLTVPKGTQCRRLSPSHWVVGDLSWLVKRDRERIAKQLGMRESEITQLSITHHDATHYGITIDEADLENIQQVR